MITRNRASKEYIQFRHDEITKTNNRPTDQPTTRNQPTGNNSGLTCKDHFGLICIPPSQSGTVEPATKIRPTTNTNSVSLHLTRYKKKADPNFHASPPPPHKLQKETQPKTKQRVPPPDKLQTQRPSKEEQRRIRASDRRSRKETRTTRRCRHSPDFCRRRRHCRRCRVRRARWRRMWKTFHEVARRSA